jgi:hypothetical protein
MTSRQQDSAVINFSFGYRWLQFCDRVFVLDDGSAASWTPVGVGIG